MTAYDSIERGAADECEPLRGRRPRTFTFTHLLVVCGAVCVCAIGATTAVNTHLVNTHEDYPEGAQFAGLSAPFAKLIKNYKARETLKPNVPEPLAVKELRVKKLREKAERENAEIEKAEKEKAEKRF